LLWGVPTLVRGVLLEHTLYVGAELSDLLSVEYTAEYRVSICLKVLSRRRDRVGIESQISRRPRDHLLILVPQDAAYNEYPVPLHVRLNLMTDLCRVCLTLPNGHTMLLACSAG
jgi:hypothetical protein